MPFMQAILAREFGGPEVLKLEEVPDPSAGAVPQSTMRSARKTSEWNAIAAG